MRRLFGLALAAAAMMPLATGAHLGAFVVPIYELPTSDLPDLHDGTLEDWEAVVPGPSADHRIAWSQVEINSDDLAWRAFLAWHWASQRLYVGIDDVGHDALAQRTHDTGEDQRRSGRLSERHRSTPALPAAGGPATPSHCTRSAPGPARA